MLSLLVILHFIIRTVSCTNPLNTMESCIIQMIFYDTLKHPSSICCHPCNFLQKLVKYKTEKGKCTDFISKGINYFKEIYKINDNCIDLTDKFEKFSSMSYRENEDENKQKSEFATNCKSHSKSCGTDTENVDLMESNTKRSCVHDQKNINYSSETIKICDMCKNNFYRTSLLQSIYNYRKYDEIDFAQELTYQDKLVTESKSKKSHDTARTSKPYSSLKLKSKENAKINNDRIKENLTNGEKLLTFKQLNLRCLDTLIISMLRDPLNRTKKLRQLSIFVENSMLILDDLSYIKQRNSCDNSITKSKMGDNIKIYLELENLATNSIKEIFNVEKIFFNRNLHIFNYVNIYKQVILMTKDDTCYFSKDHVMKLLLQEFDIDTDYIPQKHRENLKIIEELKSRNPVDIQEKYSNILFLADQNLKELYSASKVEKPGIFKTAKWLIILNEIKGDSTNLNIKIKAHIQKLCSKYETPSMEEDAIQNLEKHILSYLISLFTLSNHCLFTYIEKNRTSLLNGINNALKKKHHALE